MPADKPLMWVRTRGTLSRFHAGTYVPPHMVRPLGGSEFLTGGSLDVFCGNFAHEPFETCDERVPGHEARHCRQCSKTVANLERAQRQP